MRIPNATKWTEERVKELLVEILHDSRQADILYLGSSLIQHDLYKDVWRYWKKRFAGNDDIIETMLKIETIFEVRLYEAVLRKEISPAIAMMGLKRHHGWGQEVQEEPEKQEGEASLVRLDKDTIMIINGPGEMNTYKRLYNPPPFNPDNCSMIDTLPVPPLPGPYYVDTSV